MTVKPADLDRVASLVWHPSDKLTPYSFGAPRKLVRPMLSDRAQTAVLTLPLPAQSNWQWRKTSIPRVERRK